MMILSDAPLPRQFYKSSFIKEPEPFNAESQREKALLNNAMLLRSTSHERSYQIFLERLRDIVAGYNGVANDFLINKIRKREYVEARFLNAWMVYMIYGEIINTHEYGRLMGDKDHSTWLHAKRVFSGIMETERSFRKKMDRLWNSTKDLLQQIIEYEMPRDRQINHDLMRPEKILHSMVVTYLKYQYPDVLFNTDLSGVFLTPGLAAQMARLRSDRGHPDLVIYEPRNGYYGLFVELKAEGVKITTEVGTLVADSHIRQQAAYIQKLKDRGYCALFAVGFDEAKNVIDNYLKV